MSASSIAKKVSGAIAAIQDAENAIRRGDTAQALRELQDAATLLSGLPAKIKRLAPE